MSAVKLKGLEVHEHCIITGPHAHFEGRNKFSHSHEGGDIPHVHDDGVSRTGPGAFTIDKDEWYAATGLKGGGRKKFTAKPSGPQMPLVRTARPTFDVVIVGDGGASVANGCEGGGLFTAERLKLGMRMSVGSVTHIDPPRRRRSA